VAETVIGIDPYSAASVRLTMMRGDVDVAICSGMLWQSGASTCLVTAWHCLTGTHPVTRQSLSSTGVRPDKVRISLATRSTAYNCEIVQGLYAIENGSPGWVIHPLGSQEIDIAVIPLGQRLPSEVITTPINSLPQTLDMVIHVGDDLYILGYPRNIRRLNLPLWKRASLAIDPAALLDESDSRHLLVDTATREGISGGVVIARKTGAYQRVGGNMVIGPGSHTKIIGIYSGRIGTNDEFAAQIGIVWPIRYVEEIVKWGVIDSFV